MTTKQLTVFDRAAAMTKGDLCPLSAEQYQLVKSQCAADLTDQEFLFFAQFAATKGLNPLAKEIYCWKQQGKLIFVTSIDGLRKKAQQSGRFAGRTAPEWMDKDGQWRQAWVSNDPPVACRVGVFISGSPHPTFAVVHWREFAKPTPTWKAMPAHMLAKVAECHALKAAFAELVGGLDIDDGEGAIMPEPKKVPNVAELLDDLAPDVAPARPEQTIQPPPAPVAEDDYEGFTERLDNAAKAHGWQPDKFDAAIRAMLNRKGFDSLLTTDPIFREGLIRSVEDGTLRKWFEKQEASK